MNFIYCILVSFVFFSTPFALSCNINDTDRFTSDSESSTEEIGSDHDDLSSEAHDEFSERNADRTTVSLISNEEVMADLKQKSTVRALIGRTLRLCFVEKNELLRILRYPVICVGTGRNMRAMQLMSLLPTMVRHQDFTIDLNQVIEPDYVENGFFIEDRLRKIPHGAVIFAHAGFGRIAKTPEVKQSLSLYFDRIIDGGYFIYISEIPIDPQVIAEGKLNYEATWRELLTEAHFSSVRIFLADETFYGPHACSMTVVAQKPLAPDFSPDKLSQ